MLPEKLIIQFDGACTVNPGGQASYGYIIKCMLTGAEICTGSDIVVASYTSCNVAEWAGITAAIQHLVKLGWKGSLLIHGDSKLVINQLNGIWKCKKEYLQPYLKKSLSLLEGLDWTAEWIPRGQNQKADLLSRKLP